MSTVENRTIRDVPKMLMKVAGLKEIFWLKIENKHEIDKRVTCGKTFA
jgi:hypothetical protein